MKTNPIKRVLILGLSFLVLLNSVGVFVFTYMETGFHRMIEYADDSKKDSELLSLSVNDFKAIAWVGERDFVFDGKVYDCDGISSANGKINLNCHSDNEETNLKNSLAKNFDDGSKNAPVSKTTKDFFKVFPVFPFEVATPISNPSAILSFTYSHYSKQLPQSAELSLNSPPPEFS